MSSIVHSSVSQALEAGLTLKEYKLKRLLSVERDSFVYQAMDTDRERLVTIKEHFPARICQRDTETGEVYCDSDTDAESFDKSLKAFENQTMILAGLRHHGVPFQHHLFPANGTLYRVSNYIEGDSLVPLLNRQDDEECEWFYEEEELRGFLWRVLDILDYVHGEKVLHLDLKPRYIVFTRLGNPLLTHFCSRQELFDERGGASDDSGIYLAPEQWSATQPHGPWTDLYSLAAILYKILTGNDPQRADKRLKEDLLPKLASDAKLREKYSANFLESIDKALNTSVKSRFQAAMDWQDYLLKQRGFSRPAWLEGVPKSRKWVRALWVGAGLFVFCTILWGGYKWLMNMMDFSEPPPVAIQTTEISIPSTAAVDGKVWGMQFALKDYGFGVNYESVPSVVTLNSIALTSVKPPGEEGAPPIYLSVRDRNGKPLARSKNSVHFAADGNVRFNFDEKVILNTRDMYQYVFLTEEGATTLVNLKQTRVNPLIKKGAGALVYKSGRDVNESMPVASIKFEPNSGAQPLTEALPSAETAQSPGFASPGNWALHPGVAARQSSVAGEAEASLAIDGQMSAETGALTDTEKGNGWWMVTLGTGIQRPVREIIVYNLPEKGGLESRRLSNYRIELFDRLGRELLHKDFHTEPNSWVKDTREAWVLPEVVNAHSIRIRKLGKGAHPEDAALFLAEVEVIAPPEPETAIPHNLTDWCQWSGVRAYQSKTWRNWVATYGAHRALGKELNPRYFAHTEADNTPGWWEVDMAEARPVEYIRITNCEEKGLDALRQSNFRIILKSDSGEELLSKDFYTTPGDYAPLHTVWEINESLPKGVRTMRIEKLGKGTYPYDNALILMKVEIFGKSNLLEEK